MSMTYHGRLSKGGFATPLDALKFGESKLKPVATERKVDLRLAWDEPGPMEQCASTLPSNLKGFWIDVAGQASPDHLPRYFEWAQSLNGGRLDISCHLQDRACEVSLILPGLGAERYDDLVFDNASQNAMDQTVGVRFLESPERIRPEDSRFEQAAGRTHTAYEEIRTTLGLPLSDFGQWLQATSADHAIDEKWAETPPCPISNWFAEPKALEVTPELGAMDIRPIEVSNCPFGISLRLPASNLDAAIAVWRGWLGLLDDLEVVRVRCVGQYSQVKGVLENLALSQFHPHLPRHLFGITTLARCNGLAPEDARELLSSPQVKDSLRDWDLRWSNIAVVLDETQTQAVGATGSHYLARTESKRTLDRLCFRLDVSDPQSPLFLNARRILSAHFGTALNRDVAWQFDGPMLEEPQGKRFLGLKSDLERAISTVVENTSPLPEPNHSILIRGLGDLASSLFERRWKNSHMPRLITELVTKTLPGFRYDRAAHITDKYFLEFIRQSDEGYQLLQFQRSQTDPGYAIRVGVSTVRLHCDDLEPAVGRTSPGHIFSLEALLPERKYASWSYRSGRSAEQALEDTRQVLEQKVGVFFTHANEILRRYANEEDS